MTLRGLLTFLGSILAAGLGALSPWIGPFFDFKVISDYFQPELNAVASEAVVIAFIASYVVWRKTGQEKKKILMRWFFVSAICGYFVCLLLKWTVGVLWAPSAFMTVVIRAFWILTYLATFVLLSMGLCCMVMLIPAAEIGQQPNSGQPGASSAS